MTYTQIPKLFFLCAISAIVTGCFDNTPADNATESQSVKMLSRTAEGSMTSFIPSLGINTEAPQSEYQGAIDAMPFVDVFRTARPFRELSSDITQDQYGWPTSVSEGAYARTSFLRVPQGSVPYGDYIFLYEGEGKLGFSSNVSWGELPESLADEGFKGGTLSITPETFEAAEDKTYSGVHLVINEISKGGGNYIKNIRIIMPGGVCGDVSHIRVTDETACDSDQPYESFVDKLKDDREVVVFNPDYLNFMRNFNTIRMMNLMAASPGWSTCTDGEASLIESCVTDPVRWVDRPTMSDAVWGGSSMTSLAEGAKNAVSRKGVPIEVLVELANQTGANPWFNMHHAVNDAYVQYFANYVNEHLDSDRRAYIEYSNEIWNPGFIAFNYMQLKGRENALDTVPAFYQNYTSRDKDYFGRLRYYSKRAVEIFDLWESAFSGTERLIRVMGSNHGDTVLSDEILTFESAVDNEKVDALAVAPYFSGCVNREFAPCDEAPMIMSEVETVDDVFEVIDWEDSTRGLSGTLAQVGNQADVAKQYGLNLLAYEGGQHLSTSILGISEPADRKPYEDLFHEANRDPRMKERYIQFLEGWHEQADSGTTLFTLYTQPQAYYTYGSSGLKEYLNQPRDEAPKFDAVMTFQESVLGPWWDDSIPVDSDGDGFYDRDDDFPDDMSEWLDSDNDGVGDNGDTDLDNDGIPDDWELANGLDPSDASDATQDADGDNVINIDEYRASTNPQNSDTDEDGISDDLDYNIGGQRWGYACIVVNDPNSSSRRWGINQYNLAESSVAAIPVYSIAQNRKIQSVACDPVGKTILFTMKDSLQGDYEVYELEVSTRLVTQITDNETDDVDVTRSRDGRTVAWQKRLTDNRQAIELRRIDESGEFTYKTLASASPFVQPSLSPNGKWMALVQLRPNFFTVMRYDITNNKYKEVKSIARRKKLYHPSITDDGNQVGWSERVSQRRYRVKNMLEGTTTDIVNNPEGVEHAVLSGDGKYVIYSVNAENEAVIQLTSLDTMDTSNVSDTLITPQRYLSTNWSGMAACEGLTEAQVADKQLTSLNQSLMFSLHADGSGDRYRIGGSDVAPLSWSISNGSLIMIETDGVSWSARLLAVSSNQYTVSMVVPDGQGGVKRMIDTLYIE